MMSLQKIKSLFNLNLPSRYFIVLAFAIYFLVLLLNDGFMALDEYWVGITRYIPAQSSSVQNLVTSDDVKSPLQMMPMFAVSQIAYKLGIESPYWQYRSVIYVLGALSFILTLFSFLKWAQLEALNTREKNLLLLMLCFYFAAPFSLTRPMYESVAAPWLTLAAVWGTRYDRTEKAHDLLWAVFFVSMAFVLRQQLGFCALGLLAIVALKKRWADFFKASALGIVIFILSGIPDYFLRGKFHFSLLNLTVYNYQHGADYGRKPISFYPLMIFLMCLTPFFLKKYPLDFLKKSFQKTRVLWIFLGLFVFLHSLFPQKWERFLISVVPILILIVFPFLKYLQFEFEKNRWRLQSLYFINGVLFFVASFFPPQKNLIEMSLYLDQHPEVRQIYRVNDTPGWITEAFIRNHQNQPIQWIESDLTTLAQVDWSNCANQLVLGANSLEAYQSITANLHQRGEFNVNLIEQLAYKLNPKNNTRRVRLFLFSGCDVSF